jgi:hypothetical protein
MNSRQALKAGIDGAQMITDRYLADLSDADLMVRPIPGTNHIAWQLGHLIQSENSLTEGACPGSMPKLPAEFAKKLKRDNFGSDNPADFFTKEEYLKVAKEQRAATLAALEKLSDADLDKPGPESMRAFCPTVASIFVLQGSHWLMHAGQWAIIRRKLGKPPLF